MKRRPTRSRACLTLATLAALAGTPIPALGQPGNETATPGNPKQTPEEAAVQAKRMLEEAARAQEGQAAGQTGQAGRTASGQAPGSATGAAGRGGNAGQIPGQGPGGLRVQGEAGGGGAGGRTPPGPDEVTLSAFTDAVELRTLVEYVAETLKVNISAAESLTGSVVLTAPVTVKKKDLIPLLDSLLETANFTIVPDTSGWYKVIPDSGVPYNAAGYSSRVIQTPTVKPSTLADAINGQFGIATRPMRINYIDDLGIIVATDTPRRLDGLEDFVRQLTSRSRDTSFIRFELDHIAATTARARVIELLGAPTPTMPVGGNPQQQQQAALLAAQGGGRLTNLSDRLVADASGNALIFRGYPNEAADIGDVLAIIDRANTLRVEQYHAGSAALSIAELAERLGMGKVEQVNTDSFSSTQPGGTQQQQQVRQQQNLQQLMQQQQQAAAGGPVMVVDSYRSTILYYGTDSQHAQLRDLIGKFDTESEQIVVLTYKLKNKPAADIADILNGVAFNQQTAGTSPLQQGGGGFFNNLFRNQNQITPIRGNTNTNRNTSTFGFGQGVGILNTQPGRIGSNVFNPNVRVNQPGTAQANVNDPLSGESVFILADIPNNQVIVKAPQRQQREFADLIAKLDQRSPQVYIDVQIVAVSSTDDFRLAFEQQWLAGQFAMNTNFGLGTLNTPGTDPPTGDFTGRKNVFTNLSGLTAAIIKSEYVPITITAMQNNGDVRILARPQLLVDDNVQAEIVALEEQPTSTTSQSNTSTLTNFGGYEQAGTRLTVTPSISEGGYMRLMYDIELSNFVGTGSDGFPPPKQTRNIRSDSVTIPGDATIIVGGIKLNQKGNTIAKVPLLGDIPILGTLFRDTQKNNNNSTLYVFITPRIFRDPTFRDPILTTIGPAAEAGIEPDFPVLRPALIDMVEPVNGLNLPYPSQQSRGTTESPPARPEENTR